MSVPAFFAQIPSITLYDPLSRFLGAGDGLLTYTYEDALKLAGHSCPTVAGAWLMLAAGLARLWPDGTPVRGKIAVYLPEAAEAGTTGVVAAVASLVTGARGADGFKGIAGHFERCGLLFFDAPLPGALGLRRTDTGAAIVAELDLSGIPADARMSPLLRCWVEGRASAEDIDLFGQIWQDRVRRIFEPAEELVQLASWP
jgi:hypothetical protein